MACACRHRHGGGVQAPPAVLHPIREHPVASAEQRTSGSRQTSPSPTSDRLESGAGDGTLPQSSATAAGRVLASAGAMAASAWAWVGPGHVFAAIGIGLLLALASGTLLLLFGAVLTGIALHGLGAPLARRTGMPEALGVGLVFLFALLLVAIGGYAVAPELSEQFDLLWERVRELRTEIEQQLGGLGWLQGLIGGEGGGNEGGTGGDVTTPGEQAAAGARAAAEAAARAGVAMVGVLSNIVLIAVIGLFLAVSPSTYADGAVRLVPIARRPRARQVLERVATALRWWLLGQLVSMTVLGVFTALGLWLFGVPLWLPLAILTALFTFVPFIGPLVAGGLVLLVSLGQGVETAFYVLLLFLALQNLEGFWLTPLVQEQAVRLPPAVLIGTQVLLGTLLGLPGLILAAPLAASGLVLITMLYVEDTLGDRGALPDD